MRLHQHNDKLSAATAMCSQCIVVQCDETPCMLQYEDPRPRLHQRGHRVFEFSPPTMTIWHAFPQADVGEWLAREPGKVYVVIRQLPGVRVTISASMTLLVVP